MRLRLSPDTTAGLWSMRVGESVRFALDHWGRGEWDAAMLHACNVVDATGKKRYRKLGVAARFKRTVRDSLDIYGAMAMPTINLVKTRFPVSVKSDMDDKRPDIADVIYGIHRCAHGHGDELPDGFELMPYQEPVVITRVAAGKIRMSAATVLGLLAVGVFAPENVGQAIPKATGSDGTRRSSQSSNGGAGRTISAPSSISFRRSRRQWTSTSPTFGTAAGHHFDARRGTGPPADSAAAIWPPSDRLSVTDARCTCGPRVCQPGAR